MHILCKRRSLYFNNDLLTYLHLYEHKVINQLWRLPHLEHPRTLQHIYIYVYIYVWWWSIDKTIFIWTQSYQPAVETPTLRTSQDITTDICVYNDLLTSLFFWTKSYLLAVETLTLRTSQDISHISIYIKTIIYLHNYIYTITKWSISCADPHA